MESKQLQNNFVQQTEEIAVIDKMTETQKRQQLAISESTLRRDKINLTFKDLHYRIEKNPFFKKNQVEEIKILNGVTGSFKAGEVTAIMGASGSGKTSLLNILSCRVRKSKTSILEGSFEANGGPYNGNRFAKFGAYVMQTDILLASMSPRESFQFAADLRLNKTNEQKKQRVDEIIYEFRLGKCADTFIGDENIKGISGGERRRTSIAVELITDPEVILLDEPTSGLDSFTAFLIISVLKDQANKRKTVAFTIHQPNADIYALFDKLVLMVEGKFIYQGVADSKVCLKYFEDLRFKCPPFSNIGDFFAQLMHKDYQKTDFRRRTDLFFQEYKKQLLPAIEQDVNDQQKEDIKRKRNHNTFWYQLNKIAKRSYTDTIRNPVLFRSRSIQVVFLSILIGLIFWQLDDDPEQITNYTNRNGLFFFICMNQFMLSMQPVILTFPNERPLFLKEENSKMYSVTAYYFGKTIIEIPLLIIYPLIFSTIVYFMCALETGFDKFVELYITNFLLNLSGNSFGLLLGSFFSDPRVATQLSPLVLMPLSLFCGFYKNREDLPDWISWFEYISPFKYGFTALCKSQYAGSEFEKGVVDPYDLLGIEFSFEKNIIILLILGLLYRALSLISLKAFTQKLG